MNTQDIMAEIGRMHLQLVSSQAIIDKQGAELAQIRREAAAKEAATQPA